MDRRSEDFASGGHRPAQPHSTMPSRVNAVITLLLLLAATAARKTNKDWAHMTDADWAAIEEDLEDPEDKAEREAAEAKAKKKFDDASSNTPLGFDLTRFQACKTEECRQRELGNVDTKKKKKQGQGIALGHVFVTVHGFDGCCGEDRKAISELARKWSTLLQSTGMDAAYSIWKDNQISFETKHEEHVKEVTDFLMMQPEAALVRHDLEDSYGPAATQEWIAEHEAAVAERERKKEENIKKNRAAQEKARKKEEKKRRKAEERAAKEAEMEESPKARANRLEIQALLEKAKQMKDLPDEPGRKDEL